MIITMTPDIEGYKITEYRSIVFGEVIEGVNFLKDLGAGLRNIIGGRSQGYEEEIIKARTQAMNEMAMRAQQIGADAVVSVKIDYETLGEGGMLMVTASGTAVKLTPGS